MCDEGAFMRAVAGCQNAFANAAMDKVRRNLL